MLTRRIVISACALCLAIPAAAGASPATDASTTVKATDPPTLVKAMGPYGTTTTDPPNLVKAKGPYGTTTTDPPNLVKAKGPYGTTTTDPPNLVKAIGPYGTTTTGPQDATPSTPHAVSASSNDGGDSWRTAAITGALLAALALGSALLLSARPRAEHLGT
jgi:hypothetical protein